MASSASSSGVAAAASACASSAPRLPSALLFGTGEYTTGCVDGRPATSDKPMGVVALTMFDLRARGLIGPNITLCGRSGRRAKDIRDHFASTISSSYGLDTSCAIVPSDPAEVDERAYLSLLSSHSVTPGDLAVITTPDDTHAEIALECVRRGVHCIVAKPVVQTLRQHWSLLHAAEEYDRKRQGEYEAALAAYEVTMAASSSDPSVPSTGAATASPPAAPLPLVLCGEFHKRFDPLYSDAAERISCGSLGDLSYFHAYMSQPKSQLHTFRSWLAGGSGGTSSSDISYYLNSHHLDLLHLATSIRSRPVWVQAISARGCANAIFNQKAAGDADASASTRPPVDIEDTITITVQYAHGEGGWTPAGAGAGADGAGAAGPLPSDADGFGVGVFTSSWIAPRSCVHSQQRFHFLGTRGEINIDQARRGYEAALEPAAGAPSAGLQSLNPLFMRYTPSSSGRFVGQQGYGYRSFEHFVEAARGLPSTALSPLARLGDPAVLYTTAVLEAARRSLDEGNRKVVVVFDQQRRPVRLE